MYHYGSMLLFCLAFCFVLVCLDIAVVLAVVVVVVAAAVVFLKGVTRYSMSFRLLLLSCALLRIAVHLLPSSWRLPNRLKEREAPITDQPVRQYYNKKCSHQVSHDSGRSDVVSFQTTYDTVMQTQVDSCILTRDLEVSLAPLRVPVSV